MNIYREVVGRMCRSSAVGVRCAWYHSLVSARLPPGTTGSPAWLLGRFGGSLCKCSYALESPAVMNITYSCWVIRRWPDEQAARVGVGLLGPLSAREGDLRPADRGQEPGVSGLHVAKQLLREGHHVVVQRLALISVADDDGEVVLVDVLDIVVEEQYDVKATLSPLVVFDPAKGAVLTLAGSVHLGLAPLLPFGIGQSP